MTNINDYLEIIKSQLELIVAPNNRVVKRSLKNYTQELETDLLNGIFYIVSLGRAPVDNKNVYQVGILGVIKVAEETDEVAIEQKEFELIDDIDLLEKNTRLSNAKLAITNIKQSEQIQHPYGWIDVILEIKQLNPIKLGNC